MIQAERIAETLAMQNRTQMPKSIMESRDVDTSPSARKSTTINETEASVMNHVNSSK